MAGSSNMRGTWLTSQRWMTEPSAPVCVEYVTVPGISSRKAMRRSGRSGGAWTS